jgi:hypothetical protein
MNLNRIGTERICARRSPNMKLKPNKKAKSAKKAGQEAGQ